MKILTIIGARPQFIKAAAVSREILGRKGVQELILHTGQHFDKNMSDIFFKEMDIPKPDVNLGIHSGNHGAMTGDMLKGIENVILKEHPDIVLVYGDTNSTLAGALAAKKLHCKVAHVEAGLRSFNMQMPEEINRVLVDRISDFLFCPTGVAMENIKNEGYSMNSDNKVVLSGDVMLDAALFYASKSSHQSRVMKKNKLQKDFILCTIHRAETTDNIDVLKRIVNAINLLSEEFKVVMPIHPRTKKVIKEQRLQLNAFVIDPVGYFDMIELLKNCRMVMTDSGGLQKEAFFFKKSCVTLRKETEWVELVNGGYNVLAFDSTKDIVEKVKQMSGKSIVFKDQFYGNGQAAKKIVDHMLSPQ